MAPKRILGDALACLRNNEVTRRDFKRLLLEAVDEGLSGMHASIKHNKNKKRGGC